jgi:hypothetical protein
MNPLPDYASNGVIRDRRAKNAEDDGNGPPDAGRKQQGEQLRLVACFTDSDD